MSATVRVGLVSDTHGLFDRRLPELLAGCDLILHAGDIVEPGILDELARIAPVHAVRGNNDTGRAFRALPEVAVVDVGDLKALLVHVAGTSGRLSSAVHEALSRHRAHLLVHGHSHRPLIRLLPSSEIASAAPGVDAGRSQPLRDGVLLVNPGSAGPRRFRLPRSAGLLEVRGRSAEVRLFDLASARLSPLGSPVGASW
jgi:putative phosphoesterase